MSDRDGAGYAFGHSEAAADRLALVAEVFQEPSRAILAAVAGQGIGLAVDLGCGPGFTTALVGATVQPERLAGIDISQAFLDRARRAGGDVSWYCHDVTRMPLPSGPADLVYARWVLSHLAEPEVVLGRWLGQLRPGGHLVIEEDEYIAAYHPVLVAYEEMAASVVSHRGGNLYVGGRVADFVPPAPYAVVLTRMYEHRITEPLAARLFGANFAVWRDDPFVTGSHSALELDALARDLDDLAASGASGTVTFGIRQVVFENWRTKGW